MATRSWSSSTAPESAGSLSSPSPSTGYTRGSNGSATRWQVRKGIGYARMYRVPAATLLVPLSGLMAVAGALSVMLGVWADLGALLLIAFLLPVAFFMHAFWRETDEQ